MSRRPHGLLGWLLLAAAGGTVVAAGAGGSAAAQEPGAPLSQQDRRQAQEIYASQCASCHGASGNGGTIPGTDDPVPPLADNPAVTVSYLDLTMRVGRMPPPEADPYDNRSRTVLLDDRQREIVVAYLAEQFDIPGQVPEVPEGDPARGREVYATNCAQCHGSTGAGGVAGAGAWTPTVSGSDPVTVVEAIRVGPFEMPAFNEEQITDEEAADVAAFLTEVGHEQGTPVVGLLELNPVYASAFAALLTLVVMAAVLVVSGKPTWFPDPAGQHQPSGEPAATADGEAAPQAPGGDATTPPPDGRPPDRRTQDR